MSQRIACAHAPQLGLQAILRRDPELWQARNAPAVLASGKSDRARIVHLTTAARRMGIRPGLTVAQARSLASAQGETLRVLAQSEADTNAAQAALQDLGLAFAPRIDSESERVFFEVGDLGALYPTESAVMEAISRRALQLGLAVRVGLASNKGLARLATRAGARTSLPAAQTTAAAQLAGLSIHVLLQLSQGFDEAFLERLSRWGIRTLGQLARLPEAEVGLRLGPPGSAAHRLATGIGDEPFAPQPPADAILEATEFDHAIDTLEPLAFVLRGLIDRALARLACRGLACASLTLRLSLDPRGYDIREVPLGAPCRQIATLLELLRLDLARRPPEAGVTGAELLMLPARVRPAQLDFLRPPGPAPERMAATLAKLQALVGIENVGAPTAPDDLREEQIAVMPWKNAVATVSPSPQTDDATLPGSIRRYRPPQPLEVLMGQGGPTALRGERLVARVLVAAGPYRASGAWWQDEAYHRDYWDVHASDGAIYRMHQDRQNGNWFLDGYYD
jgi:protein ImuB